jgi:hypothetical protein
MSEGIIGRPLLKAIGLDLEAQLETNHDVLNNTKFDANLLNTVNTCSFGKASRSSYSGLQSTTQYGGFRSSTSHGDGWCRDGK